MLTARDDLDTREQALLGISFLRTGEATRAERPLGIARAQGDQEAQVEYGNWLRSTGKFEDAIAHFLTIQGDLHGDLLNRCLRWLGVAYGQAQKTLEAMEYLDRARQGCRALNDALGEARINMSLGVINFDRGDLKTALNHFEAAEGPVRKLGSVYLKSTLLNNLARVYAILGRREAAQHAITELESMVGPPAGGLWLQFQLTRAILLDGVPDQVGEYETRLDQIIAVAEDLGDHEHLIWGYVKKIELMLQLGRVSEAMQLVYRSPQDAQGQLDLDIRILRGMTYRHMGNLNAAILEFREVVDALTAAMKFPEVARVQLQLAYALYLDAQAEQASEVLKLALQGLLRFKVKPGMRHELEEMAELLRFAAMEPDLALYLEPVMDSLAVVLGDVGPHNPRERVRLQLHTFGRATVTRGRELVEFSSPGALPLLVFLILTPNRTRQEIQLALYPGQDVAQSSSRVRKGIQELREVLGFGAVLTEGPRNNSRYRIGPLLNVQLDVNRCYDAVNQGELARALAIYRGDFLPGFDDSGWVVSKREEVRQLLTFELHSQMIARREQADWRRVILLANQYLRINPNELLVHQLRIEAAERAGMPEERSRFQSVMHGSSN